MTVDSFVECAPHEGRLHLIFEEYELDPYFACDSIRKDHSGWKTEGKPTATMQFDGDRWALCYDYDEGGLDPRDHKDYHLQSAPEFKFYLVAKDGLYDGERADKSQRIRGGTITVRPRWPDLKSNGKPVRGVPNLGKPYIDCEIQVSNINHELYHQLVKEVMGAFGIAQKYFREPHDMSNWLDTAVYVRISRSLSGPVHAADGPIARTHQLLEGDREGFRKHTEDHRKIPGYYVSTQISDNRAADLIKGHILGKEIKHYYPKNPKHFDPDHPLYHPKLEISYQTAATDKTVYWSDTQDLIRELEETLLNTLEWSELSVLGGEPFVKDEYFTAEHGDRRSRKLSDCPLPKIEDAQENAVMSLWGAAKQSDKDLIGTLLTDGGSMSPKEAADKTGYSYRTIRECIKRCQSVIRHTYDELQIDSKHQRDLLLKRVRSAEESFRGTIEDAVLTTADAVKNKSTSAWSRIRRRYNITVNNDPKRELSRKIVNIGYQPSSRRELERVIRAVRVAYRQTSQDKTTGITAEIVNSEGVTQLFDNLTVKTRPHRPGDDETKKFREEIESVPDEKWEEYGMTPPS